MANWCNTSYRITGRPEHVVRLTCVFKELNALGKHNLEDLIDYENEPLNHINCRGEWFFEDEDEPIVDGVLWIQTSTAWHEMADWRQFIESHFDVKVYFLSEEFGMRLFETNDQEHLFFSDRFYFYVDRIDRPENAYYETLESLIESVQDVTHTTGLKSYEDCEKALDDMQSKDHTFLYTLIQLSYAP